MSAPSDPIAAVTHPNPYPYYEGLVARAPLAYDANLGFWVAASAEAVTAVLTSGLCRVRPPVEPVPRPLLGSPAGEIFSQFVRMNDGPRHQALKPEVTAALEAMDAQEEARRLAALLVPKDDPREPHQINDFVFRFPLYTVASLLGVPEDPLPHVVRWIGAFVSAVAPGSLPDALERGKQAAGQLLDLFRSLFDAEDAILANRIGFLFQTHDATAGLIGNTLLALASRPGPLRKTILDVIRYDPPVQNTRRFVAQAGLVAGQPMKEGDAILVVLAAANRDPKAQHAFTFGMGPHACPGQSLAVTIAEAGIESILKAGVDLEKLADGVSYRPSVNARIPVFGD